MKKGVVALLIGFMLVTACTVTTTGSVVMDCTGFTASNWAIDNGLPNSINVTALAFDSTGKTILDTTLGTLAPGSHSGLSITVNWSTAPAPGQIVLILSASGGQSFYGDCAGSGTTGTVQKPLFTDGRLNTEANATVVAYCSAKDGLVVYGLNTDKYYLLGKLSKDQIEAGLARAKAERKHVLLLQESGQQVWALKSGEIQLHNATGYKYDAILSSDRCGQ